MKNSKEVCKKIVITLTKDGYLYSLIEGTDISSKFGKRKITNSKYIGSGDFVKNSLKELKKVFSSISKEKEFLEEIGKLLEEKEVYLTTTGSIDNNCGIVGTQTLIKDILGNNLAVGDVIGIYENNIRICDSIVFYGQWQQWPTDFRSVGDLHQLCQGPPFHDRGYVGPDVCAICRHHGGGHVVYLE